jgi:putative nucleotidyltransferase with HDIG domain
MDAAIVDASGRSAALAVNSLIAHELEITPLDQLRSGEALARFNTDVRDNLFASGIDTIKIWNTDATLVYSSDGADVGRSFPEAADIREALSGQTVSQVVRKPDAENRVQFERIGTLVEVYSPLFVAGDDAAIGVFEIYQTYGPVQAAINETRLVIWTVVVAGAFLLYFTQLQIVRRAAARLKAAENETRFMNSRLEDSLRDLEEHSVGTLQALLSAVDAKDSYTARHSVSVTDYALAIGRRLQLTADEMLLIEQAGLLHDIGKIGVPESILLKPSKLTPEERASIEEHSDIGARILESIPFVRDLIPVVRYHHEWWDGSGYPEGLAGERIPRLARVLAVADAFDAMMSDRPYRVAMHLKDAREELLHCRGRQFDPECADALLEALDAGELWGVGAHASGTRDELIPLTVT